MSDRYITYSPALTLVPTYECFNRCSYCNFRVDPGQDTWLSLAEAERRLRSLSVSPQPPVIEILLLSGEVHPQHPRRQDWLQRIYDLAQLALDLGFLPHTNVGPLSFGEMKLLGQVNVSMGLMLEQLTPKLLTTVHRSAPSKRPELRLEQLDWAGQLRIPFTTGLLLGIGEDSADRRCTLEAIVQVHQRWGHIQEVILQPHSPGQRQGFVAGACDRQTLIDTVKLARAILPPEIVLQVPPNLVHTSDVLFACLDAGARDLGGIAPIDEVNPDYQQPMLHQLQLTLAAAGWRLKPRLPIHECYLDWLPESLQEHCREAKAAGLPDKV